MKLLLDTHILLWALMDPSRLSQAVRKAIESQETLIYVSLALLWELRIKETIGKITLPNNFYTALEPAGYELLSIKPKHIQEYGTLPMHHRDPFDRMLIAQARCEQLILASEDASIKKYNVATIA